MADIVLQSLENLNVVVSGALQGEKGAKGDTGSSITGPAGQGVPTGGTILQVLRKNSTTDFDTQWVHPHAVIKSITQTGHGFTVGKIVRFNGSAFVASQADTVYHAEVTGIVSTVVDANTFLLTTEGYVPNLAGLAVGAIYFLSPSVAGGMTVTEPTTVGYVDKPLLLAYTPSAGFFHNYRGQEL